MPEFNPVNEVVKKQYEEILLHAKYRDPKTVRAVWNDITLFETFTQFADFKTFNADQAKSFKLWLEKQKNKDGDLLSVSTIRSMLKNIRSFFEWLAIHPQYVKKIDGRAIPYLRQSDNDNRAARATREIIPPSLEEVETVLKAMPFETDIEKRDQALMAFTVITCARDDALVSLKRKHVDKARKNVWQDPKLVRTKNRKGISTTFIREPMPFAEDIVMNWLDHIDNKLQFKLNDPLFPKTLVKNNPKTLAFEPMGLSREHWSNTTPVREIFKQAFHSVGLPYYNPHSFRNMVILWGLANLNQWEFKALSQNIGHEHVMTTYNSYAKISEAEQHKAMRNVGQRNLELQSIPTDQLLAEMAKRAK